MAEAVYLLCAGTSAMCATLLFRAWRIQRTRVLLWSTLCFALLTLNNVLLFIDLILVPTTLDLSGWRSITSFAGVTLLLFGLIWESR